MAAPRELAVPQQCPVFVELVPRPAAAAGPLLYMAAPSPLLFYGAWHPALPLPAYPLPLPHPRLGAKIPGYYASVPGSPFSGM